jgi:hypothetical protein
VRYTQFSLHSQPARHCFRGRVPKPHLQNPSATMVNRSCPALKNLLATLGLWTILCSSYPSYPGNGTAILTGSLGHTRLISGEAQDFQEVVPTGFSTSHNPTASKEPSASQSGCSYVLEYATFWPGPTVITRTDSTICPSLASTAAAFILCTIELISVCSVCNVNSH